MNTRSIKTHDADEGDHDPLSRQVDSLRVISLSDGNTDDGAVCMKCMLESKASKRGKKQQTLTQGTGRQA